MKLKKLVLKTINKTFICKGTTIKFAKITVKVNESIMNLEITYLCTQVTPANTDGSYT